MSQYQASQSIIRYLRFSGMHPDEFIPVDHLSDLLIHDGMSLEDLEMGLVLGLRNAWLQTIDDYVGLTEAGFMRYETANDNNLVQIFT